MNAPLPLSYWEALRRLAEPFELMKFTLIYDGPLPAGGDKRALYASKIRNDIHPQLKDLWESHVIMRQLARTARVHAEETHVMDASVRQPKLPDYNWPVPPAPEGFIDLCAPIAYGEHNFIPIVRESLHLACFIDILFLRHEEPSQLFDKGGDLDNRIKCFFDGLTVPKEENVERGEDPIGNPLCCLLENDKWISGFSIRTGRLLGRCEKRPFDVRILAEISVNVLRIRDENLCLLGS
jgi:hypothetical protein